MTDYPLDRRTMMKLGAKILAEKPRPPRPPPNLPQPFLE